MSFGDKDMIVLPLGLLQIQDISLSVYNVEKVKCHVLLAIESTIENLSNQRQVMNESTDIQLPSASLSIQRLFKN